MFPKRAKPDSELKYVISAETAIRGSIVSTSKAVMEINGRVEGEIEHAGLLVVGPRGFCTDRIRTHDLRVAGQVLGRVIVEEKLEVMPGGNLTGEVYCGRLQVYPGGTFRGTNHMAGANGAIPELPAHQAQVEVPAAEPVWHGPEPPEPEPAPAATAEPDLAAETAAPEPAVLLTASEPETMAGSVVAETAGVRAAVEPAPAVGSSFAVTSQGEAVQAPADPGAAPASGEEELVPFKGSPGRKLIESRGA